MSSNKIEQTLLNLEKALGRLGEALQVNDLNSLSIDGTILRFRFAVKLYWKTLKRLLEVEGIETKTPRESLKIAFAVGWLDNERPWLQMLRDRNKAPYIHNEEIAKQIYENIVGYFPIMKNTFKQLQERFKTVGE